MKTRSLRARLTAATCLFLFASCLSLTLLSNRAAGKMVEKIDLIPLVTAGESLEIPASTLLPAAVNEPFAIFRAFQKETLFITALIVLAGSAATYWVTGYVLKPIRTLTREAQSRNADNLNRPIDLPDTVDEVRALTLSFNRMLEELQRSFTLQKQFSADAAHELRTPLAVMQANLDVYKLSKAPDEETAHLITALCAQLDRLTVLIEELLWFSQDLPLSTLQTVPLRPLLDDIADELSCLAARNQVTFSFDVGDTVIRGQDHLLERVFYNLMDNAIKYSPVQSVVTISAQTKKEGLLIDVSDNGFGIPDDCRDAIFEPFFRVDKSRGRAQGGSGLGLAVCRKILERHHATIEVFPNASSGSTFRIRFPS